MIRFALIVTMTATLGAAPLAAQSLQGRDRVPAGHMPPPGMCRVWIDGVPPGQQPAPTDCASAVRNRPPNGRVIFGEDVRRKKFKGKSAAWNVGDRVDQKRTRPVDGRYARDDDRDVRRRQIANACEDRDRDASCEEKVQIRESRGEVERALKRRRTQP